MPRPLNKDASRAGGGRHSLGIHSTNSLDAANFRVNSDRPILAAAQNVVKQSDGTDNGWRLGLQHDGRYLQIAVLAPALARLIPGHSGDPETAVVTMRFGRHFATLNRPELFASCDWRYAIADPARLFGFATPCELQALLSGPCMAGYIETFKEAI